MFSGKEWNLAIVKRICAKLSLKDHLDWTEQRSDGANLNELEMAM